MLELEAALAKALHESSSVLTNNIICSPAASSVFHSEFDNFDQFVSSLSGSGSVHTAHGIMLQEVNELIAEQRGETLCQIPKTKERSWKPIEEQMFTYVSQKKSPCLDIQRKEVPGCQHSFTQAQIQVIIWILSRIFNSEDQTVPGWSGFISKLGNTPTRKTTIDYYPVIFSPITQYATVHECLKLAEQATDEVDQRYVFTTFDHGVCMKAYPLLWNIPEYYNRHIVLIGTFHLTMAYYKMNRMKMEGSGFEDVSIEANNISPGSVQGVLTGENFSRVTNCHKVMLESLHHLLKQVYKSMQKDD